MEPMRCLLLAALALVGCSAGATEPAQTSTQADGVDAGPKVPECDGTNFRHVCNAYPATATVKYGVRPTCKDTPFLATDNDGGAAFRPNGQAGCVDVGYPVFDGPPYARCCP